MDSSYNRDIKWLTYQSDAILTLINGNKKKIQDIAIGDKVAIQTKNGEIDFSDIYAFGHQDPNAYEDFIHINIENNKSIELSPLHFIPIVSKKGSIIYKYAIDITTNDILLSLNEKLGKVLTYNITIISFS
ncbi:hypothetical protein SELMODRAFT_424733 [Selaginella moellendorffii]|uniref:Hedgehog protein Hint domain-containing protein n=1 Tax=Selaginella moellendorffii TaxID=88036 RepID=D8SQW0_SELML|nr:hypothetical protein SELMODRAFT_424733 [Selaginella moellendorffii]